MRKEECVSAIRLLVILAALAALASFAGGLPWGPV
jgi:hypothetical protein